MKRLLSAALLSGALALATIVYLHPARAADTQETVPRERRSALDLVATADDLILLERAERGLPPVEADPDEASIARLAARLLPHQHYSRRDFDTEIAARFLDRYLASLDNLHLHFLETDLKEFEVYRDQLHELTSIGNTEPARRIFERFLLRVEQRVAWVGELLKQERFEFTSDDTYRLDREKAPRPRDLDEARKLWRQHLRFEILQEILGTRATTNPSDPSAERTEPEATPSEAEHEALRPNGLTAEVEKTITRRYARLLKTLKGFEAVDVFQIYLSALAHAYDPHSDYLGRATLENFAINMNLSLFGIGAVLQSVDGYCKVKELRPGPAMRSKRIKPGDRIVAVAQGDDPEAVDVVDMKLSRIVELIRGPKGSQVRLTLIPADATDDRREVTLIRDEIRLEDEEAKAKIIDLPDSEGRTTRIGLIELPSFYGSLNLGPRSGRGRTKSTTVDVARLLSKLKQEKVEGIILDLRDNGGGSLEEAIDLTGLFIERGPVVQVRDARHQVFVDMDPSDDKFYDGPLVVLTSRFSASASEILAGCLQDYGRALIVGDSSTHGKGTVQSLIELRPMLARASEPGALKLTIRKFYRASGGSTQLKGIEPDIVLPSINNVREIGEGSLDDPLPWDTISAARFEPEDRIAPILSELRRRSNQRIETCPEFVYIREDIERYLDQQNDRQVSLNLAQRLREKADHEAREEARKQERLERAKPDYTVYPLTLKDVDQPGLPPPMDLAFYSEETEPSEDDDAEEASMTTKPSRVDATLDEAKRIAVDLIELSRNTVGLARRQDSVLKNN